MYNFITGICRFIWDLLSAFRGIVSSNASGTIGLSSTSFDAFLDKPLISGDLINITTTFRDLIIYIVPIVLVAFFIIFVFKIVYKIIGLIRI